MLALYGSENFSDVSGSFCGSLLESEETCRLPLDRKQRNLSSRFLKKNNFCSTKRGLNTLNNIALIINSMINLNCPIIPVELNVAIKSIVLSDRLAAREIDESHFRNDDHRDMCVYIHTRLAKNDLAESRRSALILQWAARFLPDDRGWHCKSRQGRRAWRTTAVPFIYNRRCGFRVGYGRVTVYGGILPSLINDRPVRRWRQSDSSLPRRVRLFAPALRREFHMFSRKEADSLTGEKNRRKREAIAQGRENGIVRCARYRETNKTRRWNCTRPRCERLVSPMKNEIYKLPRFYTVISLDVPLREKCRDYCRKDFQWGGQNFSFNFISSILIVAGSSVVYKFRVLFARGQFSSKKKPSN